VKRIVERIEMVNRYSGYCYICGEAVEIGEGLAERRESGWSVRCKKPCTAPDENTIERKQVARDSAEHDAGAEANIK
jgi:hypothetical protein